MDCRFLQIKFFYFCIFASISVGLFSSEISAQKSVKPTILRKVNSEEKRDPKLEAAIVKVAEIGEGDSVRYYYNRVDLNGDKKPEVLVYLFGSAVCGTGGCNALLLQKTDVGYKQITFFGPVRNPIIVSQNKTKGWNDLVFLMSAAELPEAIIQFAVSKGKHIQITQPLQMMRHL